MLAYINLITGFIEEVNRLNDFPEITHSDETRIKIGNYNIMNHKPVHNGTYDERLFGTFANSVRKLIILKYEPIQIQNIHKKALNSVRESGYKDLQATYLKLQNYLAQSINSVTQISFNYDGGTQMETITVKNAINAFFTATEQHSKPEPQKIVMELNALSNGNFTEMIRICLIDIVTMLNEYKEILEQDVHPDNK